MSEESTRIRVGTITCEKTRKLKVLKSLHKLIHACKCTDRKCEEIGCEEMKTLVVHFKVCTKKQKRKDCLLCRQLLALCLHHAKNSKDCEAVHCVVPYCAKIKFKLDVKKGVHPLRAQLWKSEHTPQASSSVPGTSAEVDLEYNRSFADALFGDEALEWLTRSSDEEDNPFVSLLQDDLNALLPRTEIPTPPPPIPALSPAIPAPPLTIPAPPLTIPAPPPAIPDNPPLVRIPGRRVARCGTRRASYHMAVLRNQTLLKKLLHSQTCLSEEERGVARWPCFETDCGSMKNVIRHIAQCHLERECTRIHCASAKYLLNHWRSCQVRDCGICKPLRMNSQPAALSDWKTELLPGARDEIVDYAIAILMARRNEYTEPMKRFVKESEHHAFHTSATQFEYCQFIASQLSSFGVKVRLWPGYEMTEQDVIRVFQAVLSPNSTFRQGEILNFMKTHGMYLGAVSTRSYRC